MSTGKYQQSRSSQGGAGGNVLPQSNPYIYNASQLMPSGSATQGGNKESVIFNYNNYLQMNAK
jgi:hypothetical protein